VRWTGEQGDTGHRGEYRDRGERDSHTHPEAPLGRGNWIVRHIRDTTGLAEMLQQAWHRAPH
jgi:hypothetical protein